MAEQEKRLEEKLEQLKDYLRENPLQFTEEQKQKIIMDVVSPRSGIVCDEYVEFRLWSRGLKPRQEYFADYVEEHLPLSRYPKLLEVGCGAVPRLSVLLNDRGYTMTAMDSRLETDTASAKLLKIRGRKELFHYETTDLSGYDAVIAQEPCEATEHIIRACLAAEKPFIISLCGTPHTLISGEEPETVQDWYAYLSGLIGEKGTVQKRELIPGFICFVAETSCL